MVTPLRRHRLEARRAGRWLRLLAALLLVLGMLLPAGLGRAQPQADGAGGGSRGTGVDVKTDGEVSFYIDSNDVTVVTPAVGVSVADPVAPWNASASYLADVVTAASPDIIATASPRWTELRHAATIGGGYGPVGAHASLSREPDYTAVTAGLFATAELDDKHITARFGYSYGHDVAGRRGTPFSVYALTLHRHILQGSLAFVVNRSTTFTVLADGYFEHGRQEKPYRYVALFAATTAPLIEPGASVERVNALRLPGRTGEQLPEQRQRYALTGQLAHRGGGVTVVARERLYADSWAQLATSSDLRLTFEPVKGWYLWPQTRVHYQSPVSFWQRAYVGEVSARGVRLPPLRTGDREHGRLAAVALGLGSRWIFGGGDERRAWQLGLQLEGGYTHYFDTLFVTERWNGLGVLQLQKEF